MISLPQEKTHKSYSICFLLSREEYEAERHSFAISSFHTTITSWMSTVLLLCEKNCTYNNVKHVFFYKIRSQHSETFLDTDCFTNPNWANIGYYSILNL